MYHYTPVQIRFNDIDVLGHLNNTIYTQFFDIGKLNLFQECLGDEINWGETTLVLVHIDVDFYTPIFLGSKIVVKTSISGFGNKSFSMEQKIENTITGETHCSSKSVQVAFNSKANESVVVPESWKKKLTTYME